MGSWKVGGKWAKIGDDGMETKITPFLEVNHVQCYFPQSVCILDCFHAAQQVHDFASWRSNVEGTFSAVKRKFGNSVGSKADTGMVNEVLCKLLCHDITCLIQEQETLGISSMFWKDEEQASGERVTLPLVRS